MHKVKFGIKMLVKLYREVDGKKRYYTIELYEALTSEFVVKVKYGNLCNKNPTGNKIYHFGELLSAKAKFYKIKESKIKKGYTL